MYKTANRLRAYITYYEARRYDFGFARYPHLDPAASEAEIIGFHDAEMQAQHKLEQREEETAERNKA